jgi:hypothetical protein
MSDSIMCDGCGRTLTLPAPRAAGEGWLRHSLHWNGRLHFAYTCPACPESKGAAVLERLKV